GTRRFNDEDGTRRVPRRVSARFARRAQYAGREARRIELPLDQLVAGEGLHRLPVVVERKERVMLLGGEAGLRLEPVGEVSHASRDSPLLDYLRDDGRDGQIQFLPMTDRSGKASENILRKLVLQLSDAGCVDSELLRRWAWDSILFTGRRTPCLDNE